MWKNKGRETADCEVCVTLPPEERVNYTQLHAHHVIGRKNKTLFYDLRNRCFLCPTHHKFGRKSVENDAMWFLDWFAKNRPEDSKYVRRKKEELTTSRTIKDMEEIIEELGGV